MKPSSATTPRCLPAGLGSQRRARNRWVQMGNLPGVSMSPMVPGPMWRTAKFEVPLGGPQWKHHGCDLDFTLVFRDDCTYMDMDQYLLIPCLGGWTSIYQLFWCHQGYKVLTHCHIIIYPNIWKLKNPIVVDVILINSLNYTCIPQGAHRFLDLILLHCSVKWWF